MHGLKEVYHWKEKFKMRIGSTIRGTGKVDPQMRRVFTPETCAKVSWMGHCEMFVGPVHLNKQYIRVFTIYNYSGFRSGNMRKS